MRTRRRRPRPPRRRTGLLLLTALAVVVAAVAAAFAAGNTVPQSYLSENSHPVAAADLAPAACSSLTLTNIINLASGATYTITTTNNLVLGTSANETITDNSQGSNCIDAGGGTGDNVTGQHGKGTSDVCIHNAGTYKFC